MQDFYFQPSSSYEYTSLSEEPPLWISHSRAWVRILEKTFPQMRGYIASDNLTIDENSTFLPVFRIRKPLHKPAWLSIPYATISDIVPGNRSEEQTFLGALRNHPLTQGCRIEIRSSCRKGEKFPGFSSVGGYINHQLLLDGDEDEIFGRFHKKAVQARIRQSLRSGLTLRVASSLKDVKIFYALYVQMRKQQGLPPQPYRFFASMWEELSSGGHVDLLLAQNDGRVVAGSWALKNSWMYSLEYLARAGRNDKLRCAYFLNWHGIKRAMKEGIKVVSFARTSTKNEGLNNYKRGWATKAIPYCDLISPVSTDKHREERVSYRLLRKYSTRLPTPLFRLLGECIYRLI